MKIMFQVTINNIIQYICQCRIRPPNRAGGKATYAEPTPTQGMGGWEAVLTALPFGARSKSASSIGIRTACSNTDAGPAVPAVAALLRCTDGIPSAHVRNRRNPFRPTLAGPKPTKVSRYIGLSAYGMSDYRYGAYSAYEAYRPRPLP